MRRTASPTTWRCSPSSRAEDCPARSADAGPDLGHRSGAPRGAPDRRDRRWGHAHRRGGARGSRLEREPVRKKLALPRARQAAAGQDPRHRHETASQPTPNPTVPRHRGRRQSRDLDGRSPASGPARCCRRRRRQVLRGDVVRRHVLHVRTGRAPAQVPLTPPDGYRPQPSPLASDAGSRTGDLGGCNRVVADSLQRRSADGPKPGGGRRNLH